MSYNKCLPVEMVLFFNFSTIDTLMFLDKGKKKLFQFLRRKAHIIKIYYTYMNHSMLVLSYREAARPTLYCLNTKLFKWEQTNGSLIFYI